MLDARICCLCDCEIATIFPSARLDCARLTPAAAAVATTASSIVGALGERDGDGGELSVRGVYPLAWL